MEPVDRGSPRSVGPWSSGAFIGLGAGVGATVGVFLGEAAGIALGTAVGAGVGVVLTAVVSTWGRRAPGTGPPRQP